MVDLRGQARTAWYRKAGEHAMRSEPVRSDPPWLLPPLLRWFSTVVTANGSVNSTEWIIKLAQVVSLNSNTQCFLDRDIIP